jgi:hypothetical protein
VLFGYYYEGGRWPAAIPKRQIELDLSQVNPIKPQSELNQESIGLFIPTDMQATSDGTQVGNQVLDHGVQNLLQGKYLKNSPVVQTAQKMQEVIQPKVGYTDASGVEHTLNLEVEAFQGFANLKYEGYLTSKLTFKPQSQDVQWVVSEELSKNSDLSVEHDSKSDVSWLKLSFGW